MGNLRRFPSRAGGVHPLIEQLKAHGSAGAFKAGLVLRTVGGDGLHAQAAVHPGVRHGHTFGVIDPYVLHAVVVGGHDLHNLRGHLPGGGVRLPELLRLAGGLYVPGPQADGVRPGHAAQGKVGDHRRGAIAANGRGGGFRRAEQAFPAGIVGVDIDGPGAVKDAHPSAVEAAGGYGVNLAAAQAQAVVHPILQENFRKVATGGRGLGQDLPGYRFLNH